MTVHDNTAATEHVTREPLHRQITFEGFRRSDGLFEIEGYLTDQNHTISRRRAARAWYRRTSRSTISACGWYSIST